MGLEPNEQQKCRTNGSDCYSDRKAPRPIILETAIQAVEQTLRDYPRLSRIVSGIQGCIRK